MSVTVPIFNVCKTTKSSSGLIADPAKVQNYQSTVDISLTSHSMKIKFKLI